MKYVVDASFALAFLLPDERSARVDAWFEGLAGGEFQAISCSLLPYEVANGLLSAHRRKRLDILEVESLFKLFMKLGIEQFSPDLRKSLTLASMHQLSLYDASYVQLALEHSCRLMTLDDRLKQLN